MEFRWFTYEEMKVEGWERSGTSALIMLPENDQQQPFGRRKNWICRHSTKFKNPSTPHLSPYSDRTLSHSTINLLCIPNILHPRIRILPDIPALLPFPVMSTQEFRFRISFQPVISAAPAHPFPGYFSRYWPQTIVFSRKSFWLLF